MRLNSIHCAPSSSFARGSLAVASTCDKSSVIPSSDESSYERREKKGSRIPKGGVERRREPGKCKSAFSELRSSGIGGRTPVTLHHRAYPLSSSHRSTASRAKYKDRGFPALDRKLEDSLAFPALAPINVPPSFFLFLREIGSVESRRQRACLSRVLVGMTEFRLS